VNSRQKTRLVKAIKTYANVKGNLWDGEDGYCILGGLAKEVGKANSHGGWPNGYEEAIRKRFGINGADMNTLMRLNDRHDETSQRRQALLRHVESKWGSIKVVARRTTTAAQKQANALLKAVSRQKDKVKVAA
jgi:hypothetical protein